jgi:hypothetical protein
MRCRLKPALLVLPPWVPGYRWRGFVILLPGLIDGVLLKILAHATCGRCGEDAWTYCYAIEVGSAVKVLEESGVR